MSARRRGLGNRKLRTSALLLCVIALTQCGAPQRKRSVDPRSEARAALESGSLERAERLATRVAAGGGLLDQLLLAEVYLRRGKHAATVELLQPLFASHRNHASLAWLLATALDAVGDADGALTLYARRLALVPHDQDAAIRFAQLLLQRGEHGKAAEVAAAALNTGTTNYNLLTVLGEAQLRRGRLPMARKAAAAATQMSPDKAPAWLVLARVEMALGEPEGANKAITHALRADPNHVAAMRFGASLKAAQGDISAAVTLLTRALTVRPDDVRLLNEFAAQQFRLGRFELAANALKKALKLAPKRLTLHRNLIEVLLAAGHVQAAERAAAATQQLAGEAPTLPSATKTSLQITMARVMCAATMMRFDKERRGGAKALEERIRTALQTAGLHLTSASLNQVIGDARVIVKRARLRLRESQSPTGEP